MLKHDRYILSVLNALASLLLTIANAKITQTEFYTKKVVKMYSWFYTTSLSPQNIYGSEWCRASITA